jgi:L-serine dehydratase
LQRKAQAIYAQGLEKGEGPDRFLAELSAFGFAAAEENGAGHVIVTAPTAGSAGVIPACLQVMHRHWQLSREQRRRSLLIGAVIGFLAKHNASIAGAEVGCQGEIGVASAMAAAMLAYGAGCDHSIIFNAAEIALEHHLGMTCDPLKGYVQIPCIERNGMGAVKAYTAYVISSIEIPRHHKVGFDNVLRAMAETGRDMDAKYRETAMGGLAVAGITC